MNEFLISGFADEISSDFSKQLDYLNAFGLKYIEPRNIDGTNISDIDEATAKDVAARLKKAGIGVSAIGSPIGKQHITEDFGTHFAKFERTIEIAKILGAKRIRMFSFYYPKGEEKTYRAEIFRRLRALVDMAEKNDILLCHENENGIYGDSPEKCLEIMKEFGGKIRSVFDPCNFVLDGFESYPHAFSLLNEYIEYFHIKDGNADGCICAAGRGIGGIPELLREVKASGRVGTMLTLEPHLRVFAGLDKLSINHEELKRDHSYETPEDAFSDALSALRKIIAEI